MIDKKNWFFDDFIATLTNKYTFVCVKIRWWQLFLHYPMLCLCLYIKKWMNSKGSIWVYDKEFKRWKFFKNHMHNCLDMICSQDTRVNRNTKRKYRWIHWVLIQHGVVKLRCSSKTFNLFHSFSPSIQAFSLFHIHLQ